MKNIFQLEKSKNTLKSLTQLLDDGVIMEKLMQFGLMGEHDFTILINSLIVKIKNLIKKLNEKNIVTVEFHLLNNLMILNGKKNFLKPVTLSILFFPILVAESIFGEKIFAEFCKNPLMMKLKKLLLSIKTDLHDLVLIYWNTYLNAVELNSWFSISQSIKQKNKSLLKICCHLSKFSTVNKWVQEDIKLQPKELILTKKIKLKLNNDTKRILRQWIGTCRYLYNSINFQIRRHNDLPINFQQLRNKFVTAKNNDIPEWQLKVPKEVRAYSVKELVSAYMINLKKFKKTKKQFKIRYKNKKAMTETITLPKQSIKISNGYVRIYKRFIKDKININNNFGDNFNEKNICDYKITYVKPNRWYLLVPIKIKNKQHKINNKKICALDPGFRCFMTGADLEGKCFKIGENVRETLIEKEKKIDNLQSQLSKAKNTNNRCGYIRKLLIYKNKQHKYINLINELHNKTIKYLTDNYEIIIIPKFSITTMHKTKKFNRMLHSLAHSKFLVKLQNKCNYLGKKVIVTDEKYTTKTCCNCGYMKKMTNEKTYKCDKCKIVIDRDINGAINILQKTICGS